MIKLRTGISVPASVNLFHSNNESISSCKVPFLPIIAAHGLGSKNPKLRNHLNEDWLPILHEPIQNNSVPNIFYTARGHGESDGWQENVENNLEQFTWSNLAEDMMAVADYYETPSFIAVGNSIGSATSFFAMIKYPERVKALIMIRPPTAWKAREERRKVLIKNANACQKKAEEEAAMSEKIGGDVEKHHYVLRGSALSDLFPLPTIDNNNTSNTTNVYQSVTNPMLILAVRHDINHPILTAETLASMIPQAELHIAENKEEAESLWPAIITEFVLRVNSNNNNNSHVVNKV